VIPNLEGGREGGREEGREGGDNKPQGLWERVRGREGGRAYLLGGAAHRQGDMNAFCHFIGIVGVDDKSAFEVGGAAGKLGVDEDAEGGREGGREEDVRYLFGTKR